MTVGIPEMAARRLGAGTPKHRARAAMCALALTMPLVRGPVINAKEDVTIRRVARWSNVFGNESVDWKLLLHSSRPFDGVTRWSFSARGRIVARGEVDVRVAGGESTEIAIPLRVPAVREGVVFDGVVSVEVTAAGTDEPRAKLRDPIWMFPKQAFADRMAWLKELDLHVFDPVGDTTQTLAGAEIPHQRMRSLGAAQSLDSGVLIVGEGISWAKTRSLAEVAYRLARRGVPVLCLAPADGRIAWPVNDDASGRPLRVSLRRADVIHSLDKRLDAQDWLGADRIERNSLSLSSYRGRVAFDVVGGDQGWPWLEVEFDEASRAIVCGFGLIKAWDKGPTPRYLFLRLLERLSAESADNKSVRN